MPSSKKDRTNATDMLTALDSPEMRRVCMRVLHKSNLLQSSYTAGDSHGTAFNEGLRAVGLWLKSEIDNADPEAFARLLSERRNEE